MNACQKCGAERIILYRVLDDRLLCRRCHIIEKEAQKRRAMK